MRLSPSLLLLIILSFVFMPTLQEWIVQGGANWYRPFIIWLVVIVYVFITQSGGQQDES